MASPSGCRTLGGQRAPTGGPRSPFAPAVVLVILAALPWSVARAADRAAMALEAASRGALRHVHQLAEAIGPRKTGSDGERRAIDYIRQEMTAAGLQVSLEDVTTVDVSDGVERVGSWYIVGDLPGDLPDRIVVAAHHDTRDARVPGANDDGSGLAVLLEVARRTAARPRGLSYRFISFCAEEEGLLGSRHHVRHAELGGTRAMVALEVVGRGDLLVGGVPRPAPLWAQEAFLAAARDAGLAGIAARPLWAIAPRLIDLPYSADHEPFLDRGIPAFLLAGAFAGWAYHTPEDRLAHVDPVVLGRAVLLLETLFKRLETDPPRAVDDAHYLPLTVFGRGFTLTSPGLRALCGAALAAWAVFTLLAVRQVLAPRSLIVLARVVVVTGAVTAFGAAGPFAAEAILERVHGVRFPWMAHQGLHLAFAAAALAFTSWVALNIFRRIKPTVEPAPYLHAALLIPAASVAAGLAADLPEIAAFPAVPLAAFIISRLTTSIGRKAGLGLLALLPFLLILTPDDYRVLVEVAGIAPPGRLLFGLVTAVALPFALYAAHVASFQDCLHSRFWWWLSGRRFGGGTILVCGILGAAAAWLPAYDAGHRQVVRILQTLDLDGGTAEVRVTSNDSLDGVVLSGVAAPLTTERETRVEVPVPAGRFAFEAILETAVGVAGPRPAICRLSLKSPHPTDRVEFTFASTAGFRLPVDPGNLRHEYRVGIVAARLDPVETVELILPPGADLSVTLEADFVDDLLDLRARGRDTQVFVHRGRLQARRQLAGS